MAALLKSFGKGCLYILVLPVLLVILAVYAVLGVVMFIYILIRGAILYFTGRNFGELAEDIKARAILEGRMDEKPLVEEKVDAPTEPQVNNNDYASHFYVPVDQFLGTPKSEDLIKEAEDNNPNNDNNEGGNV